MNLHFRPDYWILIPIVILITLLAVLPSDCLHRTIPIMNIGVTHQ